MTSMTRHSSSAKGYVWFGVGVVLGYLDDEKLATPIVHALQFIVRGIGDPAIIRAPVADAGNKRIEVSLDIERPIGHKAVMVSL